MNLIGINILIRIHNINTYLMYVKITKFIDL